MRVSRWDRCGREPLCYNSVADNFFRWGVGNICLRLMLTDGSERPSLRRISWLFELQYLLGQTPWDTGVTPPEVVELVGARHEAPLTHAGHMIRAIEKFLG